ncbi:hypothetical protein [Rhodohalobacter halophilus]|uniref:hypothetical protein n=1 Tax=Rhodohalobacter halophilus TaxID=1812810 RepID=UPI000A0257D7|nr:hypothetical protein [Rhodohalobacter halophilus]
MIKLNTGNHSNDLTSSIDYSRRFGNLFNSYAKAFNKMYDRKGTLFVRPFKRVPIDTDHYFGTLLAYIHLNPVKHGFVEYPAQWPFSSYRAYLNEKPSNIDRETVFDWFGSRQQFFKVHDEIRVEQYNRIFEAP